MVSELTHAAWNTLETLNNLEKYLETFALLSNHSVLMLSLPEISEMLAMNTGSSGDAEIFKQRNWPKEVVHNFFIQIACLLCGWTAPWICIIKQSTVLAGLTGTETANHCRSWQYKRPLTNGRNRKKTIFQPVHHKHSLSSEQAGSSDFPAFILHWGSRPQARQQEFLVTGALVEQAGQQGSAGLCFCLSWISCTPVSQAVLHFPCGCCGKDFYWSAPAHMQKSISLFCWVSPGR